MKSTVTGAMLCVLSRIDGVLDGQLRIEESECMRLLVSDEVDRIESMSCGFAALWPIPTPSQNDVFVCPCW
jgi:hypothetical protein